MVESLLRLTPVMFRKFNRATVGQSWDAYWVTGLLSVALVSTQTSCAEDTEWNRSMDASMQAYQQGRYTEAEQFLLAALKEAKDFGEQDPRLATSLNNLALLYRAQGKYEQAEPLLPRALTISEKALGPEHPDVAKSLNNLASLYQDQGKYEQAEPLYQRSLTIGEKALGPEHPDVAKSLNNLASLYQAQGKYEQAEPLYQRSLTISEKALGPEHPDVAKSLNNLASLYQDGTQYEQAEPLGLQR